MTLKESTKTKQNYDTQILTALLFILKLKIFMKTLLATLKDGLTHDEDDKRPLPIGKNKKVIRLMKGELEGKIMKEFCGLRAKTYAFLMDNDTEKKKAKETKKCVIKRRLMFDNYKDCLFNDKVIRKTQQRFKSDHHEVYTEEVNNITLRLQTLDKIIQHIHKEKTHLKCAKVR